jgi:hypothetical protein
MQGDPNFRDHILFYEFFHGDDGHGLGASHQTGWTGLVAKLLRPRRKECQTPLAVGRQRVAQAVAEPLVR